MSDKVQTNISGPLFDGSAENVIKDYLSDVEEEIAKNAENEVRQILKKELRNPTGLYERHIQTDRQANDFVVTDGGVVYGPWLEGTSSRNNKTRFKGYAAFRRATKVIQDRAVHDAELLLDRKYLDRLS